MTDIRTLVVDDDFRVAKLHSDIVTDTSGFTVVASVGTIAAARRVLTTGFDLLLVDLYLPDGSGIDLARALDRDFIVLSAAAEPRTVAHCLARGALGYLVKPFDGAALQDRLQAYRRYRALMGRAGVLTQADIDRAVQVLHGSTAGAARPKGHSGPTEAAVERAVVDSPGPLSAADVAEAVGISRATANRYLSHLSELGRIGMQLRYGATGRPEHLFGPVD